MALTSEIAELVAGGVAVIVATRSAELIPEVGRGWGPEVAEDGGTLTVCIAAPEGSRADENLRAGSPLAVTCSVPTTYRTVQIKGTVLERRSLSSRDLVRVEAHLDAFAREAAALGIDYERTRRLVEPGLVTVTISVSAVFDQTPGTRAGLRL